MWSRRARGRRRRRKRVGSIGRKALGLCVYLDSGCGSEALVVAEWHSTVYFLYSLQSRQSSAKYSRPPLKDCPPCRVNIGKIGHWTELSNPTLQMTVTILVSSSPDLLLWLSVFVFVTPIFCRTIASMVTSRLPEILCPFSPLD
jgi:hypothetical protein